jgi:hypothetical protein
MFYPNGKQELSGISPMPALERFFINRAIVFSVLVTL